MTPSPFQYDAIQQVAWATWDDCLLRGTNIRYDAKGTLCVDVRATRPDGTLLHRNDFRILTHWEQKAFAEMCDATPDGQLKVQQYLVLFGDFISEKLAEMARESHTVPGESAHDDATPATQERPRPRFARISPLAPPLPQKVILAPAVAEGAALWLEAYISHSAHWSPRAASNFHTATGLWMLSTIAARRVAVELGSLIYPSIFLALIARSTLYAKTTTAKIARSGLRHAGGGALLAADRATPQALLRSMAGAVPESFGAMDDAAQIALTHRVAFAAQRGWYYEEWGTMLHQMTRKDSPVSEFHGLLKWLDDGDEQFESETISRGLEHISNPYLALLCSATPHDLAPFMRPGSTYWHDGFWPRFAFITPLAEEIPSRRRQPAGIASLPSALSTPLNAWHQRLGIPKAQIEEISQKEKPTGRYKATIGDLPCQILTITDEVLDAYYAYNDALLEMIIDGNVSQDLDSSYGRFHAKALRIAMLLASVAGYSRIERKHWAYAQEVTEQWRLMLHVLVDTAESDLPRTREEMLEERIERALGRHGPMTRREMHINIRGYASREIETTLAAMIKAERVYMTTHGKKELYALPGVPTPGETSIEGTNSPEVPF